MHTAATSATGAASGPPTGARPRFLAPWASCLDRVRDLARAFPLAFGPPAEAPRMCKVRFVEGDDDPVAHLATASALAHPFLRPAELEHSLAFAVWFYTELGAEVCRWRADVLQEVSLLLEDMRDEVAAWPKVFDTIRWVAVLSISKVLGTKLYFTAWLRSSFRP